MPESCIDSGARDQLSSESIVAVMTSRDIGDRKLWLTVGSI